MAWPRNWSWPRKVSRKGPVPERRHARKAEHRSLISRSPDPKALACARHRNRPFSPSTPFDAIVKSIYIIRSTIGLSTMIRAFFPIYRRDSFVAHLPHLLFSASPAHPVPATPSISVPHRHGGSPPASPVLNPRRDRFVVAESP